MTETLDDVRAAIVAAQAEREKANVAAAKAAAAEAQARQAERVVLQQREEQEAAETERRRAAYPGLRRAAEQREQKARETFDQAVRSGDLATAGKAFVAWRTAMAATNGLHEQNVGGSYPHVDIPRFTVEVDRAFATLPSIAYPETDT